MILETDRLILRQWRECDAEALYKYASDKKVSELALWPCHTSLEMSREVIRNVFIPNPFLFAIVLKETEEAIGCIGLVPQDGEHYSTTTSEREVGYWLGRPHWGKGLTTEALKKLSEHLRDTSQLKSLLITTDARNLSSQRVAEKCGFKFIENYIYNGVCSKAYKIYL